MPTTTTGNAPTRTSASPSASCTTATPGENGWVPLDACNSQYAYDPIFEAHISFSVLFGLSMMAHIVQAVAWKKRFCWVLLFGVSWEFLAFVLKALGAKDQQQVGYVVPAQLLFLLAPLWINAFAYMVVARLVHFAVLDQRIFRIKARTLTRLFVLIDVFCFLTQAAGGILMSNTDDTPNDRLISIGRDVYMSGCGAQLFFVLVFCGIIARLLVKTRRERLSDIPLSRVRLLTWVMLAVLILIVIRVIFRLVEFSPASEHELTTKEVYALVLDALPMLIAFIMLNIVHPGWVLRGPNSEFPKKEKKSRTERRAGRKEKKTAKKEAKAAREADNFELLPDS